MEPTEYSTPPQHPSGHNVAMNNKRGGDGMIQNICLFPLWFLSVWFCLLLFWAAPKWGKETQAF